MKYEPAKLKTPKPDVRSSESLYELYRELLSLREEVKSAELRAAEIVGGPPKASQPSRLSN